MRPDRRGGPGMTAYYTGMIYLTCFAMGIRVAEWVFPLF